MPPPYAFDISFPGPESEINETGAFGIIVVSRRLGETIGSVADSQIQRIPVSIRGHDGEWDILNVLRLVDCLDHNRSVITSYYPEDFHRREYAGTPSGIIRLIIDPDRVGDEHIFRIKDWDGPVIVSECLRDAVEESATIGVRFQQVTP